jgi:hypothetical protein
MRQIRDVIQERQEERWRRDVDLQERATSSIMLNAQSCAGVEKPSVKGWSLYPGSDDSKSAGGGRDVPSVDAATARFGPQMVPYSVIEARAEEMRRERAG